MHIFVEDNVNNLAPSIVISSGWDVSEDKVQDEAEGDVGGDVRGDVGGNVIGEMVEGEVGVKVECRKDDDVPELTEEVYLFSDSDNTDWMEGESNDGDGNDSTDGDDDEKSEDEGSDELLDDVNSIESVEPFSDQEPSCKIRKRNFSLLEIKGSKPFKVAEGGQIVFKKGQLFIYMNEFRNTLRDYTVLSGYELKRVKNELERVTAHYLNQECN